MSVAVRKVGLADASHVEELLTVVRPEWTDGLAPAASGAIAFVADSATFMFGAWRERQAVGVAWGVHTRSPDGRMTTELRHLEVVAAERRQGIATLLLSAAEVEARSAGSAQLSLWSGDDGETITSFAHALAGTRSKATQFVWSLG